jgi:hypothetical protein
MTDEQITHTARAICVEQSSKQDNGDWQIYASGGWDHTVWMRLVEKGIRKGMETERAAVAEWLLSHGERQTADSVKRADYIKEQSK